MSEEKRTRRQQSKGKCAYCGVVYARAGMTKHLPTCKAREKAHEAAAQTSKGKAEQWFHLLISHEYATNYWIQLEIGASNSLQTLDQFLRDIWLECCGHLSRFTIGEQAYSVHPMDDFGEQDMKVKLGDILKPGLTFRHEYDYGTTTEVVLKVVGERSGFSRDKKLTLMSRNQAEVYTCEGCGKAPATLICTQCMWNGDEQVVCETCKIQHRCYIEEKDDYMFLPITNSPRMGMCGYEGSEIYP